MATLTVTKSYTASSAKANVVFKLDYTVTTSDPAKVTVKANGLTVDLTSSGSGEALTTAKNQRAIALNDGLSVSLKLASTTMLNNLTVDSAGIYPVSGGSTTQNVSKAHSATSKTLTLTAAGVTNTATVSIPIRTSYTVTVNPNGGSGGTTSLKKWYGETLTLPNPTLSGFTAPTRSGWKFLGLNASSSATSAQASYTANSAGTLYAVWQRQIGTVTLSVDTYRVKDGSSSVEDDEGEWCYGVCSYNVTGSAPGTLTLTVSADPTCSIVQDTFTVSKLADATLEGAVIFRASGCSVNETYVFSVHASCTNEATGVTQTPVTADMGDKLSPAYYPMDILGDAYYYNLTTDTAVNANKTYYTQSGDGSEDNPIVYTKVVNPVAADLGEYYEVNGERPAHGISFGAPCKKEGFHVCMAADFGRAAGNVDLPESAMENGYIRQFTNTWDYSQVPSSNVYGSSMETFDSAGHKTSYLQSSRTPTSVYRSIATQNPKTGGVTAIYLYADDNGEHRATMTSGTAWPVANGGTGITNFGSPTNTNGANVSVATSSWTQLTSFSLAAGKWLLIIGCYAAGNSTGYRRWALGTTTPSSGERMNWLTLAAPGNVAAYGSLVCYLNPSSTTTEKVYGYQNSGGALNMSAYVRAIRIG